jgi:hypothetical protein
MKYANHIGWSDVTPYEVVRVISDKTIEVRSMKTERDTSVELQFIPGGFSAHCANQSKQKWFISSDENGNVFRIRLQKTGYWKDFGGNKYKLDNEPVKFYDYNF